MANVLHPLLARTRVNLRERRSASRGLLWGGGRDSIDLTVSRSNARTAISILSKILRRFRKEGITVRPTSEHPILTLLKVDGEELAFRMREKAQQKKHVLTPDENARQRAGHLGRPDKFDYFPTDLFVIEVRNETSSWSLFTIQESKTLQIEDSLDDLIARLRTAAAAVKEQRAEAVRRHEAEIVEWNLRQERERIAAEKKKRFDALRSEAAAWQEARLIREYVAAVRDAHSSRNEPIGPESEVGEWVAWARERADELDPGCAI